MGAVQCANYCVHTNLNPGAFFYLSGMGRHHLKEPFQFEMKNLYNL